MLLEVVLAELWGAGLGFRVETRGLGLTVLSGVRVKVKG